MAPNPYFPMTRQNLDGCRDGKIVKVNLNTYIHYDMFLGMLDRSKRYVHYE